MKIFAKALVSAIVILGASNAYAMDAGDAKKGKKVFKKCKACHVVDKAKNKSGPHLLNIIDRDVASVEDFKYSKAMTDYGAGDEKWTAERLTVFLTKPKKEVPKTKMAFGGLKKEKDLVNLLAYLAEVEPK